MSNKINNYDTQYKRDIDEEFSLGIQNINGRNAGYSAFETNLEGMVCTACGEVSEHGELAFTMNFGVESRAHPLSQVMRFTGLAWHAGGYDSHGKKKRCCLKASDLPGCKDREGIDKEFSRALVVGGIHPGSRETH